MRSVTPALAIALVLALGQEKDLVGRWTFDDGKEAKAAEASGGAAGVLVKEPKWVEGRLGGALAFGGSSYVEIPNSEALENVQEGSYSLACWFKAENLPPGDDEEKNDGAYGLIMKQGWHLGLRFNREGRFVLDHWIKGEKENEPVWAGGGTWDSTYEAGKWHHVAGVVDKAAGSVKLYVNGEPSGGGEFEAGRAAREYGQMPWRIGIAGPGAEKWSWPARGAIDDVRIHRKALSEAEVAELARPK